MHTTTTQGGNMVGPCSCGLFHQNTPSAFCMLFSTCPLQLDDPAAAVPFQDPFVPSSVDCTLSLGTPSTRLTDSVEAYDQRRHSSSSSYVPSFCWGGGATNNHALPRSGLSSGATNHHASAPYNSDPLFARRCANCDTTSTPLWRNGPRGPKSLCNACGIRFKKEERRAAATSMNSSEQRRVGVASGHNSNAATNSLRFADNQADHANNAISFLPWQLNVALNDFTTY